MTNTQLLLAEPAVRVGAFLAVFVAVAGWEALAPRRPQTLSRTARWPGNLGIAALNTLTLRVLFPTGAVGVAIAAEHAGWGLFHSLNWQSWLAVPVAIVALDLAIYLQHVLFHFVPALWRLHRLHHADTEFDVTTGARFHPVEIGLSMVIKLAAVAALGAPPLAVLVFEVLLNATAMFNHANLRLAAPLDRALRLLVVTPDMHRVHHSARMEETNSNFGFNLPWWDRLFDTYRAQPHLGHDGMVIGLDQFRDREEVRLLRLLTQPFREPTAAPEPAWVAIDELARRLAAREVSILDVRDPTEFDGPLGHLPGALNIPLAELATRTHEIEDLRESPLTLVCLTEIRSAKAFPLLRAAGFRQLTVLRGGVRAWVAQGHPVEHASPRIRPLPGNASNEHLDRPRV